MAGANLPEQVEPIHVGHSEIDHREVGRPAQERAHRLGPAGARDDVETDARRQAPDDLQHGDLVVDDEEQWSRGVWCRHRMVAIQGSKKRARSA